MTRVPVTPTQDSIIGEVLPAGYVVRGLKLVGDDGGPDVDAAYSVVQASESRVNGTCESPRGETLEGLTDSEADPAGARLVLAPDGEPVGYLSVITDREARAVFVDAYAVDECGTGVTPTGLLGALVRAGLLRGSQLADDASGQWTVKFVAPDADTEYREAIVHEGLTPIRIFYRMRIGFEHQALAPPLPEGVTVGVVDSDDERRLVHEVVDTSFADHWDHTPHSVESFISYATRAFGYDPSRWWLLRVDGVPAAVCVGSDEYREIGDGYIKWLGVLRDFRGQGLAKLLLRHAFHSYASNGYSGVRLGVDASSPTGATHLYKSVGMSPIETLHVYNRDVT
jgi:mycothiol synthase